MSDITNVLAIAAGAVPGALSRYQITEWTKAKLGPKFPYGTFIINLTGCLVMIGVALANLVKDGVNVGTELTRL